MMVWIVLFILLVFSGAVSAAETALFALNRKDLHEFHRSRSPLKRAAYQLMLHPRRVLLTVLISNTAVNIAFFAVSANAFGEVSAAKATAVGAVALFLVIVAGELLPKALALGNARLLAPPAAAMIRSLQIVLAPIIRLLSVLLVDPITRLLAPSSPSSDEVDPEELRLLVEQSARVGHIDTTENELLQAIVALPEASIREVMTPRVDIEFVRMSDSPGRALQTIKTCKRRILPVCGRDLDDVRGLIFARDALISAGSPTTSLLRLVRFVPEQLNLAQLVRHFHDEKTHFAIVVDEYGGTSGLVTVDDVVEWIVGDLPESEAPQREAQTERIDETTYRLSGDLSVRDWAERFGVEEVGPHVDTVAGLILAKLGRLPRTGDSIRIRNLTLTVDAVRRRRIDYVVLRLEAGHAGEAVA